MTKQAALAAFSTIKLTAKVIGEVGRRRASAGTVADQTPKAGSLVTTQTAVTLTVSNGGFGNLPPVPEFAAAGIDARSDSGWTLDSSG